MAFVLDRLADFAAQANRDFAREHQDEVFHAFAVDANLRCLNSEEWAAKRLEEYQLQWDRRLRDITSWEELTSEDVDDADFTSKLAEKYGQLDREDRAACLRVINKERARRREQDNPYRSPEGIAELRSNTGDWQYQGFAEMSNEQGFDPDACDDHYYLDEEVQGTSLYNVAMDRLVHLLKERNAFGCPRTSDNFYATRVEHDY